MADYRQTLSKLFERRRTRNAFYSLRSFARDAGLSAARICEVMNGKKGISAAAAGQVCQRLGIEGRERDLFLLSVEKHHARSRTARSVAAQAYKKAVKDLGQPETIDTVVDWVTEATLKLCQREGPRLGQGEMSRVLGTPQFLVTAALRFLRRLGFIDQDSPKAYLASQRAGRRLQVDYEQILERARHSYLTARGLHDYFDHTALLLDADGIQEAQRVVQEALERIRKLESRSPNARLFFHSAQIFQMERGSL